VTAHDTIMEVGFIGLGQMGVGMAGSLLRAGHEVTVYNRTPSKAQALIDQGANIAPHRWRTPAGAMLLSQCWPTMPP